jgi:hypothetical protein
MEKKKLDEELIHVKLDYDELVESKRKILSVELAFLKILKSLKIYSSLRREELDKKFSLRTQMNFFNKSLVNLRSELPKLKIPKILRKEGEELEIKNGPLKKPIIDNRYSSDLDYELQKIQDELKKLQ